MDERIRDLEQAIGDFLAANMDPVMSASRAIDPLLEIWGLASQIDRSIAVPVEELLTALIGRQLASREELAGAMDELRAGVVALAPPSLV